MRKYLTFILVLFLISCIGCKQKYNIADVTKPEAITIKKDNSQGNIHRLQVVGKGYIEGTANIVLIENGKPYKSESLSGEVNFVWDGDWYYVSAQIEYDPNLVKSGTLDLEYKFYDL
jgi:hypothetical protein